MNTKRSLICGKQAAVLFVSLLAWMCADVSAQVPGRINYQGRVTVAGTNFNGTGQFKFALVNSAASQTYWSNGVNAVSLTVTKGLYAVQLGDTAIANMGSAIPSTVFTNSDVYLRVWFNDGVSGLQQLIPDVRLASVGYAMMSANVPDGAVTSNKIADGAVTAAKFAAGAVGSAQLATGAVTAVNMAGNAITAAQVAAGAITSGHTAGNTITAANLAPGIGLVPPGTLVLSATASNAALVAAGYAPQLTVLGVGWTQATNNAGWAGRYGFGAVTNNGKLWVMGGARITAGFLNDVWSSSDGITWQWAANAPWIVRSNFGAVTFNDKMWVLGGFGSSWYNDVWSSSNGVTWTQVTNAAPWHARYSFGTAVLNGQMWIYGGAGGITDYRRDVWSTSDGVTWTQVTNAAPWAGRLGHAAAAFNNKLWVLGGCTDIGLPGTFVNDVWASTDGANWIQITNTAPWGARMYHAAVVFDGKMWLMGGVGSGGVTYNDVWSTSDGVSWTRVTNSAAWYTRFGHGALVHSNQLFVLGGRRGNSVLNDVWFTRPTFINMLDSFYLYQKQ